MAMQKATTPPPRRFRLHIQQPPFMLANAENSICAFTQKARKFAKMMVNKGHEVFYYGHEDSEVECTELIPVVTKRDFRVLYKLKKDPNFKDPNFVAGNHDAITRVYNMRSTAEITKRCKPWDFLCCFWGVDEEMKNNLFDNYQMLVVEPGIGSNCFFAPHAAFESYAVMHYNYGLRGCNARPYDAVIPNYFDPADFTFNADKSKCKYFVYLGRVIAIKGIDIVVTLAKRMPEYEFVFAGPNTLKDNGYEGLEMFKNIREIGSVNIAQRKELLAHAIALFLPTQYIEPFGGTTIEAMMSGTPVITTDWGVFAETVPHGEVGYRCHTMEDFEWAARNVAANIDRNTCRRWAMDYSLDAIYPRFVHWFDMIRRHYVNPEDEEKEKEKEKEQKDLEKVESVDQVDEEEEGDGIVEKTDEKEKGANDDKEKMDAIPRTGFYAQYPGRTELDWLKKPITIVGGGLTRTQKRNKQNRGK